MSIKTRVEFPQRALLAPGFKVSRIVTGLWQVADMERGGKALDPVRASQNLAEYARAGFDTFDMADHYGSAEIITGTLIGSAGAPPIKAFTKWCPSPGPMTASVVRNGVERALNRLQTSRIDLMQFHWWSFDDPRYLDAMRELARLREEGLIAHLGLTNFDTAHLDLLLSEGIPIATNQICMSLLDRRGTEAMSKLCSEHGVCLLTYGVLGGGFLSERWLGAAEPDDVMDWSKMKYLRFIRAAGGWQALQGVLQAADLIARKHAVSISNVAARWVLEQKAVAAIIVGARLGESEHRSDNLKLFEFNLDEADHILLSAPLAELKRLPGDCGDEYRKPPFLTAAGDLSHHLKSIEPVWVAEGVDEFTDRSAVSSGSVWEPIAGYSRAFQVGDRILVSGTTATHGAGQLIGKNDAAVQTTYILDKIAASLKAFGAELRHVVRTKVYLTQASDWQKVSMIHGRYFAEVRPANTMLQVAGLIGDGYLVEIEAEAVLPAKESLLPE